MTATNPSKIVEGFSVSHAAILDGTTGAEAALGNIYGVRDSGLTVNNGNYDNTGDDGILSSWFWINQVDVAIKGGYISFDLIALLSGETVTSSGAAGAATFSVPLWTIGSQNQAAMPMLVRVPSKDKDGAVRDLNIVLYKVIFAPIGFTGPTYKAGMVVDYNGRAVFSDFDEQGRALVGNHRGVGRLISTPVGASAPYL